MSAIESAIPAAGKADDGWLRLIDADVLARYVIDTGGPWWRRRPCVYALRDRVPEHHVAALLDRIRDPQETSEIRIALLGVLSDRVELLPWLQGQPENQPFLMHEAILQARGALGDLTAAPALSTLANRDWGRCREIGEVALDQLIARHGLAAVEQAIGSERPEDRVFANRMRSREGLDLVTAFADPDLGVARKACELVIATGVPDDERLLDHVVTGSTMETRLFACYALHRRGRDIRELWVALDSPRVEVAGLPEDIRLAVLREYPGEIRTDPRWLVERACVELPDRPDESAQLLEVMTALQDARITFGEPTPIGEVQGAGEGTYHEIVLGDGALLGISTLGPFARGSERAREPLERAGFRWIDEALAAVKVIGLPVYDFGARDALDVRSLLFYWND